MKKQWLLLLASTATTVLVALGLIRWLAPGLLGIPTDLQLVRVSEEIPPFYDSVLREEDLLSTEFILRDPDSIARARPLYPDLLGMGPNDLLGFRNRAVPNVADVVTLGDSQTYGNNAPLEENWPSRLSAHIDRRPVTVYNMSCGAWNGPQYLDMARKALHFRPRVVVVAFYTGNDPVGAFTAAYGSDRWADLRLDPSLTAADAPKVNFPAPPSEQWAARFANGWQTVFTPQLRFASNLPDQPAVRTGWRILGEIGRRIALLAQGAGARAVFTIIPTKELVYAERVRIEGITAPAEYLSLVAAERDHIARLAGELKAIPGAAYADVLEPLQQAALGSALYPSSQNGHPVAAGYDFIARALVPAVEAGLPELPRDLVFLQYPDGNTRPALVRDGGYRLFASVEQMAANGWAKQARFQLATPRDLAGLRYLGTISEVDPGAFGPRGGRFAADR